MWRATGGLHRVKGLGSVPKGCTWQLSPFRWPIGSSGSIPYKYSLDLVMA